MTEQHELNQSFEFDENYSLLSVIVDRPLAKQIITYAKKIGIKRFTSFRGKGTVQSTALKWLEMDDVTKEIIFFVIPTIKEEEIISSFAEKFRFDKPSRGILFTVKLSHVLGITHKAPTQIKPQPTRYSGVVGIYAIVDKGKAEEVMEIANKDSYLGGTVMPAHGSIDYSKKMYDVYVENEKEVVLMIVPESKVHELARRIADELEFERKNSGILFTFAISRVKGLLNQKTSLEDWEKMERTPNRITDKTHFDAIWTVVPAGQDQKVIQAAELGGSQGGTIFHARGAHIREHRFVIGDIEPQREVVMVVADRNRMDSIANEIHTEFRLDDPGQGILFVFPIHETIGIYEGR